MKSVGCRGGDTRRINAEHLTGGGYWGVESRETGIRRAEDRWQGTGKVLDGNTVATEWFRSDNGVVSRKIAGKKHIEDRRKIGYSLVNNPIILRISYVYGT